MKSALTVEVSFDCRRQLGENAEFQAMGRRLAEVTCEGDFLEIR